MTVGEIEKMEVSGCKKVGRRVERLRKWGRWIVRQRCREELGRGRGMKVPKL